MITILILFILCQQIHPCKIWFNKHVWVNYLLIFSPLYFVLSCHKWISTNKSNEIIHYRSNLFVLIIIIIIFNIWLSKWSVIHYQSSKLSGILPTLYCNLRLIKIGKFNQLKRIENANESLDIALPNKNILLWNNMFFAEAVQTVFHKK